MFLYCKWQGKRVDCDKVVMQRKTDDGFCCSINTIDLAESYAASEDDDGEEEDNAGGCSASTTSLNDTAEASNGTTTNSTDYDYGSFDYNYGCFYSLSGSDNDSIARFDK